VATGIGQEHGRSDLVLHRHDGLVILIWLPFPDEPSGKESVLLPAGDHVRMQVGYALADTSVDSDKGPVGLHAALDGTGYKLDRREKRSVEYRGQITQRLVVGLRDQQAMTPKKGTMIKEGERYVMLRHHVACRLPSNDLAKRAAIA
jgi:hypothetical protein